MFYQKAIYFFHMILIFHLSHITIIFQLELHHRIHYAVFRKIYFYDYIPNLYILIFCYQFYTIDFQNNLNIVLPFQTTFAFLMERLYIYQSF
nr:MAG TPA: hypothetical protein [Caudoviricetes sp.]